MTELTTLREAHTAAGKAARKAVPLEAHAEVVITADRPDPIGLLEQQATSRVPELVPIRYGRMSVSPFTFYRGAALVMASDLAAGASPSILTQVCGDAHLSNFGVFGSPERRLLFDINDFDETAVGPFEWDVKRLAASLEVVGRANGLRRRERRDVVVASVASYREAMRLFATQSNLEVWYARFDMDQAFADIRGQLSIEGARKTEAALAKARTRDSMTAFAKMTRVIDGVPRIIGDPPLVEPIDAIFSTEDRDSLIHEITGLLSGYSTTLPSDRRHLFEQYSVVDMARKVVGVGSVGTRCWIILLQGIDTDDPLFLQVKEAGESVVETVRGAGPDDSAGARVVHGQRVMQAASDIFLGYQRITGRDGRLRDYYVRQLRDWKMSLPPEQMAVQGLTVYGRVCGWTLARAHARAGERVTIASYLGRRDTFDQAIADFASTYADLTERDHAALLTAIRTARVPAITGV